ncbi:4-azaleucine resistance transporter AzlC [Deinobacterium chartae]|uniref:4-azaleucine resistance transporter AzlC n=1 Tax=Deinobacterium chartae TaxID=521158 RepID=A0A841I3U9_9DEIO|nr:AzlC family ABC transporter permease [Deinobacterium chartae]MBB6098682.1 4-azaleucine resistance transporter AzlC [Deinobacterium chartae]
MNDFLRGFRAVLPLWLGMIPFGLAYAVTARSAGLSFFETQTMSVLVFAGGAQFSAAGMFAAGAAPASIILTTLLLNARHLLYGLSLSRTLPLAGWRRAVGAHFLTDEAYGITTLEARPTFAYLLGAEMSVFFSWNAATALGAWLGASVPDPRALGVDFVFPLAFLALLVPLLRGAVELWVALISALAAVALAQVLPGGLMILTVAIGGSLLGAWLTRPRPELPGQRKETA